MNRNVKLAMLALLIAAVFAFAACNSGPETPAEENAGVAGLSVAGSAAEFSDVTDRDWNLVTVRLGSETIQIDRDTHADFFTLRFDVERVAGVGAPNRYFGPFTTADNQALSMGNMANTQMAALFEPEELKEHEFLAYLQNTFRWDLAGGNLELHSRAEDGTEAVLVFALAE